MRITNRIMQNNQMFNINNNKIKEDKYATQMATNKKIGRASEDPVVAIRALRLRSTVSELTQYYEKNAADAESWLKLTEDSLSTVTDLLTSTIAQANKGANKDLTSTDLAAIIGEMNELTEEYYATGNVDYGGRYVFTGYRTDTTLTFTEKTSQTYTDIRNGFNAADIDSMSHVTGVAKLNPKSAGTAEADIDQMKIGRIQLSYDRLAEPADPAGSVALKYREAFDVPATSNINSQYSDGSPKWLTLKFEEPKGTTYEVEVRLPLTVTEEVEDMSQKKVSNLELTDEDLQKQGGGTKTSTMMAYASQGFTIASNSDGTYRLTKEIVSGDSKETLVLNLSTNGAVHSSYKETELKLESECITSTTAPDDADEIYKKIAGYDGKTGTANEKAWVNTATGEILLTEAMQKKLSALPDLIGADTIEVEYDKSQWEKGDTRPENLFDCKTPNPSDNTKTIHYNGGTYGHTMGYDMGYAQTIDVNTDAREVFTAEVKRSMDDLNAALNKLQTLESTMGLINSAKASASDSTSPTLEELQAEYDAAGKAWDFLRNDLQIQMENKISHFQKALDVANLAVTQNGTRSRRLELIQNRLQEQVLTFKTLASDNEDIDMAETATNLMTAQTVYNAALQATGKISQQSLMDYI